MKFNSFLVFFFVFFVVLGIYSDLNAFEQNAVTYHVGYKTAGTFEILPEGSKTILNTCLMDSSASAQSINVGGVPLIHKQVATQGNICVETNLVTSSAVSFVKLGTASSTIAITYIPQETQNFKVPAPYVVTSLDSSHLVIGSEVSTISSVSLYDDTGTFAQVFSYTSTKFRLSTTDIFDSIGTLETFSTLPDGQYTVMVTLEASTNQPIPQYILDQAFYYYPFYVVDGRFYLSLYDIPSVASDSRFLVVIGMLISMLLLIDLLRRLLVR